MRISDWSSDVCSSDLLIVVHEIFGVHEWIRDMCRRFAKAGYYAIAPDLFARLGDASKERDIQALMTNFVPKTADAQVRSEAHTSELQSLMRISYAVFCLNTKKSTTHYHYKTDQHR